MLTATTMADNTIQPPTTTDRERLLNMISTLLWVGLERRHRPVSLRHDHRMRART
jgi:hypothetical protein